MTGVLVPSQRYDARETCLGRAAARHRVRLPAVAAIFIAATAACAQRSQELRVTNAWSGDLVIRLAAAAGTPAQQATRLGEVRAGKTAAFRVALPGDGQRAVIHARSDGDRQEFYTLCLTRAALDQLNWRLTIPGTSSDC